MQPTVLPGRGEGKTVRRERCERVSLHVAIVQCGGNLVDCGTLV